MGARHLDKPKWNPEISWGTVLTLIVVAGGGITVWVTLNVRIAEAATKLESVEERVSRMEYRIEQRLRHMDSKLDRLIERDHAPHAGYVPHPPYRGPQAGSEE